MESAPDQTAIESARDKRDYTGSADFLADEIRARLQVGDVVGALDYPEADRPTFWAAIAIVLDALPCVRPVWRTVSERSVDGLRTRQKMYRICPRQKGLADPMLAGLIALAAVCAAPLIGGPL